MPDRLFLPTLRQVLHRVAARLLGGTLTDRVRTFTTNVAYLFSADLLATAITFALSAWVVRAMGPVEFGLANLVIGTAQILLIPMLFGLNASASRAVAASTSPGPVIGSALLLVSVLVPCVSMVAVALAGPLARVAGLDLPVYLWSLPLAIALALQHVVQGILGGLQRFRAVAHYGVWSAAVYATLIVLALVVGTSWPFWLFVAITAIRAVVQAGLCLTNLRRDVRRPTRAVTQSLLHFGGVYTLGSITSFFALGAIDSLMLNAFHGSAAVGLYGAYFAAFNVVASRVTKLVSEVLLPAATAHGEPALLASRFVRLLLGPGLLLVPASMVLARALFVLYGDAYAFSWWTALLLGLCVHLHIGNALSADLLLATGLRGLRSVTAIGVVAGVLNVSSNLVLIPRFEVNGSLMATVLASLCGLLLRFLVLGKLRRESAAHPSR